MAKVTGTIQSFATKAVDFVAGKLNVSKRVAEIVCAIVLAVPVIGGAGIAIADYTDQGWLAVISDDGTTNCVKVVKAAKKSHGKGERQIPEESCGYRVGYIATNENKPDAIPWHEGTAQRAVYNAWKANGSVTDANGYARMGSGDDAPYIVACSLSAYGMHEGEKGFVGEQITFYFDSGASLTCIVGDAKGAPSDVDPNNLDQVVEKYDPYTHQMERGTGWGHIQSDNQIDVLEFWGLPGNNYTKLGPDYEGHRVDSFTPEGLAESVKNAEGWSDSFLDDATAATAASGNATVKKAAGKCREVKQTTAVDNSDIARAAITFAWTSSDESYNFGTDLYKNVVHGLEAAGAHIGSSGDTKDCGMCVASAVLWSGSDDDYVNITGNMDQHMRTCPRWQFVGKLSDLNEEDMQPGDVCVNPAQHVFVYVGQELIHEMRPEAGSNCNSVSASLNTRSAAIDASWTNYKTNGQASLYNVYRCIDPEHSTRFTSIAGGFS